MKPPVFLFAVLFANVHAADPPPSLSGIYPSLAMFNDEGECGTGAVVPWADRLWVVSYAPHAPMGSTDKLYEITPDLRQIIRPESIGGTPANRMIHDESRQLFIGPYAISQTGEVRTIPCSQMFGRLTGNARSLTNPAEEILCATMEEGVYEIDVRTLAVKELWGDEQKTDSPRKADLPGYHGKGFYSGQGVYIYANNGDHAPAALMDPTVPSGVLAEWDGVSDAWKIVRRNQFTEITGPGGIHGNRNPATDPIWAVGWDARSLLLGVRIAGAGWSFYRLPKGSHSYDGAHGWNTEWPRIREIGEGDLLMTMHGTFWRFPRDFTPGHACGIRPRSNHLKVVGDFCRWNDRLVFGCDDTAKSEFLNKIQAKGEIPAPQSQSNLWFTPPDAPDHLGPAIGRGAVWMHDDLRAGAVSDPYLFSGYDLRGLHLATDGKTRVTLETSDGDGEWRKLRDILSEGYQFVSFDKSTPGEWIRLRVDTAAKDATAVFTYRNEDNRDDKGDGIFNGLATPSESPAGGFVRALDKNRRALSLAAVAVDGKDAGLYELDGDLKLRRIDASGADGSIREHAAIPTKCLAIDSASVVYTDERGKRWRLPKGDPAMNRHPLGAPRIVREVATERNLLNAGGTFYELPARNAGGFAKIRPVATHNRFVHDFCSYRGLFIMTGVAANAPESNKHIIRSADGKAALWAGALDDLWKLGKPRGEGGPWHDSRVMAGQTSDPYLITAYDHKSLALRADADAVFTAQIDIHGDGTWVDYRSFDVKSGETACHEFPPQFSAYWIRFVSDKDVTATATLKYR